MENLIFFGGTRFKYFFGGVPQKWLEGVEFFFLIIFVLWRSKYFFICEGVHKFVHKFGSDIFLLVITIFFFFFCGPKFFFCGLKFFFFMGSKKYYFFLGGGGNFFFF